MTAKQKDARFRATQATISGVMHAMAADATNSPERRVFFIELANDCALYSHLTPHATKEALIVAIRDCQVKPFEHSRQ